MPFLQDYRKIHNVNSIYVLRIDDFDDPQGFTLNKSLICLPQKRLESSDIVNAVKTGGCKDEILVTVYVKLLFKKEQFQELLLPPVYIIQMIERYFGVEMLHWIGEIDYKNKHFAIRVKDILTNLESD